MENIWAKWEHIHPDILEALTENGFHKPTPVQSQTLNTYRHYTDFIIASQTGSGKTLAFGIPMMSEILFEKEGKIVPNKTKKKPKGRYLRALIISPTRELALQIENHLKAINKYKKIQIGCIIGGISKDKQKRIISYKPEILICTPGRLWDFINEEQDTYIESNIRNLDYLIVDEADRMVELGHFIDLDKILEIVYQKQDKVMNDSEVYHVMKQAHGQQKQKNQQSIEDQLLEGQIVEITHEDFLKQFKDDGKTHIFQAGEGEEEDGEGDDSQDGKGEENEDENEEENDSGDDSGVHNEQVDDQNIMSSFLPSIGRKFKPQVKNSKMKVILVSATLTQQFGNTAKVKLTKRDLRANRKDESMSKFNPKIQALIKRIKFSGKPKIIDLTNEHLMPKDLVEYKTACSEEDKYLYLQHFIKSKPNENFIIFANSISYSKKIYHVLEVLGERPVSLHSKMQQKMRLEKLDQFKDGKKNILVCTDVAARGLDIPSVKNVVHFQVPKDIDTYVHRSGRTARAGQSGSVYILVGPMDQSRYVTLCSQLQKDQGVQNQVDINAAEKQRMREVITQALSYEKSRFQLTKKQMEKNWYNKAAKQLDIDLDDNIMNDINHITDQISKKRVVMQQEKTEFKTVVKNSQHQQRRQNSLFLDPSQIAQYAKQIQNNKEAAKNASLNKKRKFDQLQVDKNTQQKDNKNKFRNKFRKNRV